MHRNQGICPWRVGVSRRPSRRRSRRAVRNPFCVVKHCQLGINDSWCDDDGRARIETRRIRTGHLEREREAARLMGTCC